MAKIENWQALYEPGSEGMVESFFNSKNMPTTRVELSVSCRQLLDYDIISKSDPQCILFMKDVPSSDYREMGRTEIVQDSLNPNFVKKFTLDYNFETIQHLKFEIWDDDIAGRDFLGRFETTLADIVSHKGRQFNGKLTGHKKKNCGEIILVVEELSNSKQIFQFKWKGYNLKKVSWICAPNPFLLFWKSNEDGSYSVVHKTEVCSSTRNPVWNKFKIKARCLCNGDFDRNIRIDCLDHRYNGNHKLIGSFYTNLNELINHKADGPSQFHLTHPHSSEKKVGEIELASLSSETEVTFLDYIRNGTEMHFAVAIDFTASNGEVSDPDSLHFIDATPNHYNSYEIALMAIGKIIEQYDTREMFPGFGFGAKIPPTGQVSHQFPLNRNPAYPYCKGISELLSAYRQTLHSVTLYGPTNFAPVINSTAAIASQYQDSKNYFVLLIITDGIICDMHHTKMAIVKASCLPMSIIIVGVGNADFSAMNELDSDSVTLSVDGKKAIRDIVQFVPLNRFLSKDGSWKQSQFRLAKEVLYEIPDQIVSYMTMKGFKPFTQN